jgi:putative FmdB family regulatory protein
MEVQKFKCNRCGEIFEILQRFQNTGLACPKCQSEDLTEYNFCTLEVGPPPWKYQCRNCNSEFLITAPRGPDEAKAVNCPVCRTKDLKWLFSSASACGTGG